MGLPDGRQVLTVIFGAGASHGSATLRQGKEMFDHAYEAGAPPLTSGLFANTLTKRKYREEYSSFLNELIPQIEAVDDLEEFLQDMLDQAEGQAHEDWLMKQLTALRFYLRDVLWDVSEGWLQACAHTTAYSGLLGQIEPWRQRTGATLNLITFNYDLILDDALVRRVGYANRQFDDSLNEYVRDEHYRLYKIHGSVNWLTEVRADAAIELHADPVRVAIENSGRAQQTARFRYISCGMMRSRHWRSL
jgi:hypothetical protein